MGVGQNLNDVLHLLLNKPIGMPPVFQMHPLNKKKSRIWQILIFNIPGCHSVVRKLLSGYEMAKNLWCSFLVHCVKSDKEYYCEHDWNKLTVNPDDKDLGLIVSLEPDQPLPSHSKHLHPIAQSPSDIMPCIAGEAWRGTLGEIAGASSHICRRVTSMSVYLDSRI